MMLMTITMMVIGFGSRWLRKVTATTRRSDGAVVISVGAKGHDAGQPGQTESARSEQVNRSNPVNTAGCGSIRESNYRKVYTVLVLSTCSIYECLFIYFLLNIKGVYM